MVLSKKEMENCYSYEQFLSKWELIGSSKLTSVGKLIGVLHHDCIIDEKTKIVRTFKMSGELYIKSLTNYETELYAFFCEKYFRRLIVNCRKFLLMLAAAMFVISPILHAASGGNGGHGGHSAGSAGNGGQGGRGGKGLLGNGNNGKDGNKK